VTANVQPQVIDRFPTPPRAAWTEKHVTYFSERGVDSNLQHRIPSREELERQVAARSGRRVRYLEVEVEGGRVVLRGLACSYHVKQLAQHGVRDLLPDIRLENAITVAAASSSRPRTGCG
jgi:hypothetical protein